MGGREKLAGDTTSSCVTGGMNQLEIQQDILQHFVSQKELLGKKLPLHHSPF